LTTSGVKVQGQNRFLIKVYDVIRQNEALALLTSIMIMGRSYLMLLTHQVVSCLHSCFTRFIKDSHISKTILEYGLKTANLSENCSRHMVQLWKQIMNLVGDDDNSSRNATGIDRWALQSKIFQSFF